MFFFFWLHVPD